jgi:hypothetical protein
MAQAIYEPDDLAGNSNWDGVKPQQLWAGEYPKHTSSGKAGGASSVIYAKYEVVAYDAATDTYIKYDPTAAEGEAAATPVGFTCQPTVGGGSIQVYDSGAPNHEALVWPASIDTLAKRKAAFAYAGSNIFVARLLG